MRKVKSRKKVRKTPKTDFGLGVRLKKPVTKVKTKGTFLNYNWKQAKKRFKKINPMGDADFDGTRNKFDCKPFDPARDGVFGRLLSIVTGGRMGQSAEEYKAEREEKKLGIYRKGRPGTLLKGVEKAEAATKLRKIQERETAVKAGRKGAAERLARYREELRLKEAKRKEKEYKKMGKGALAQAPKATVVRTGLQRLYGYESGVEKGEKHAGPGRPRGTYRTRINPFTGRPVAMPATEYYKLIKKFRATQTQTAAAVDNAAVARMARKGIPPEEARVLINQKQQMAEMRRPVQSMPTQQMENGTATTEEIQREVTEVPEGHHVTSNGAVVSNNVQRFPDRKYRVVRDIMTGRMIMQPIPQKEAWQR